MENVVQTKGQDFIHDPLHKVSRTIVEWFLQFTNPIVIFRVFKDMYKNTDYGTP